jgi:hypothetical protein
MRKKKDPVSLATARAINVFPVPEENEQDLINLGLLVPTVNQDTWTTSRSIGSSTRTQQISASLSKEPFWLEPNTNNPLERKDTGEM